MFRFLPVKSPSPHAEGLTSCLASFAHGSNDVANAIGPFSVIYGVFESGAYKSKYPVETWMLAFGEKCAKALWL